MFSDPKISGRGLEAVVSVSLKRDLPTVRIRPLFPLAEGLHKHEGAGL